MLLLEQLVPWALKLICAGWTQVQPCFGPSAVPVQYAAVEVTLSCEVH